VITPNLPDSVRRRLKPGTMFRPGEQNEVWTLFEPSSGLSCRFTMGQPHTSELGFADLESNDRAWQDNRFHAEIYCASKAIRVHAEAQEANLEINYQCHYACKHCFQSLVPLGHVQAPLGVESQLAAADRLLDAGASEISITGGDIFLDAHIWEVLDHIHDRDAKITLRLLVNGGGLDVDDDSVQTKLLELLGRRVIFKSDFFGHSAELHDGFTRVPGSFDKLVRIVRSLREVGIACLPTAVLTSMNFEKRFELVNFAYNLTNDCFTVATMIYPSGYRTDESLAKLRLKTEQYTELMDERFFLPLVAEYHTFEPQCDGNCQFAVSSATGEVWGCSFLKTSPVNGTSNGNGYSHNGSHPQGMLDVLQAWRKQAVERSVSAECPTCPATNTCRKCPGFVEAGRMADAYCGFSRTAYPSLINRVNAARREGFEFIHAQTQDRFGGFMEVSDGVQ
jgi:MoaA/NifB/PqqE/SkfB family radical SAM enzyme